MLLETCTKGHDACSIELGERIILEPPPGFNERLKRLGGLNPHGKPNFRFVWGWSRLDWIGGFVWDVMRTADGEMLVDWRGRGWNIIKIQPLTRVPKYWPDHNRWFLEIWKPPETYGTPETWKEFIEAIPDYAGAAVEGPPLPPGTLIETRGPYPAEGDYEVAMEFEMVPGQPLPPVALEAALFFTKQARQFTNVQRIAARVHAGNAERARAKKEFDEAADEAWDKLLPAFNGLPHTKYSYDGSKQEVN